MTTEAPEYWPFRQRLADVLASMRGPHRQNWNDPAKWEVRSRRLFAHYVLHESMAAIARFEGCSTSAVRTSIESAYHRLAFAAAADTFDVEALAFAPSLKVTVANMADRIRRRRAERDAKAGS